MLDDEQYKIPPTFDEEGVQVSSGLLHDGREVPDPVPMPPPPGTGGSPTLADMIRKMIQGEISRVASEVGFESFEEAEDFDVDDEVGPPLTEYEAMFFEPPRPGNDPSTGDPPSPASPPPSADPPVSSPGGAEGGT